MQNIINNIDDTNKSIIINKCRGNNFGDVLNDYIPLKCGYNIEIDSKKKHLLFIGSTIEYCNSDSIICGAGIINSKSVFPKPHLVLLVRGPLTRKRFIDLGYDCPENYGDPGLLLSHIYRPLSLNKKYKMGIIPHIIDYHQMIAYMHTTNNNFNYKVIKFATGVDSVESTINEINECEYIISSSLHGLITSHSYGIKAIWVSSFNKLHGDNVKFLDYYASIDIIKISPMIFNENFLSISDKIINAYPNPTYLKISQVINNIKRIIPFNIAL